MKPFTSWPAALALGGVIATCAAQSVCAQVPSEFQVVASGLNAPRGLKFGPDGDLYVAESGTGGTNKTNASQCPQVAPPVGPYLGGNTGAIVKISRTGKVTPVASGFPSSVASTGDLSGVADVAFLDGQLYALIAGGGCSHGNPLAPNGIARVNANTGKWSMIADLSAFGMTHPGQFDDAADFEPDGVWFSMIDTGGHLIVTEPNRGIVVAVESDGRAHELVDISASQGHIVPTGLAERDGDLYVGNLLYFPILPDWSRILHLAKVGSEGREIPGMQPQGSYYVADSKAGLTTVMAVTFGPDGLLYALELSDNAGFPAPGNGKVVRLQRSGEFEDVITGLNVPGGMAWGPDGRLYIADFSAVPAPMTGAGRILRFDVAYGY
ncbi:MAG TPA: ScyD/ScyE family protein [Steroidobacteraceae bacterium]|jgi:glucose/arabinose dehydrogenase|nr:ScyD/ScyE family protein [Steroidobacteraceae bacterium]